jgi:hypothetical protein
MSGWSSFDPASVLTMRITPVEATYPEPGRVRFRRMPRVSKGPLAFVRCGGPSASADSGNLFHRRGAPRTPEGQYPAPSFRGVEATLTPWGWARAGRSFVMLEIRRAAESWW